MQKSKLMCGVALLGVAMLVMVGSARAEGKDKFGPIDSLGDLQDTAKILFKIADTNNDGMISQKEAIDAGNLLVGGFFFRADANGDGVLTPEEARQARDALYSQQPLLRYIVQKARWSQEQEKAAGGNANQAVSPASIRSLSTMLDVNNDQKLQASEVRQAVQTSVQGLYALADTNRDGQLTPSELNDAATVVVRSAIQAAYQAADTDRNGALSMAEFDKAIIGPAHMVFRMFDTNNDNQISMDEMQRAEVLLADQFRRLQVLEPANSPRHRLETAVTPTSANAPSASTPITPTPGQPVPTPVPVPTPAPTPAPVPR